MHYLFLESLDKPETDPVLIFFNGGPGVATIQMAFNSGISPYGTFDWSDKLIEWNLSWNRRANMLLIDNPAGVGYSYAERNIDFVMNDYQY